MYSPVKRVILNQLAGIRWLRAAKDALSPVPPQYEDVAYSVSVTQWHFDTLRQWGLESVENREIVEIGPGGNLGNALLLAVAGAARVVCVDNYRHVDFQSRIVGFYRRMIERILIDPVGSLPGHPTPRSADWLKSRIDDVIAFRGETVSFNESCIQYLAPCPAEHISLPDASVDVVFSQAVLEHVHHPDRVCREFARILRPGGWTSHVIDLRDHFDASGLQMLRYSPRLWELMSSHSHGHVNRTGAPQFESFFRESGFEPLCVQATERLPVAAVSGRLDEAFASLSAEELAIVGLAVVGRRPA